jgi:hypothetical protein
LPDLGRLKSGHEDFEGAGAVHLFANDALDFPESSEAKGEKSIKPARELADKPGAQEKLV